MTSTDQKSSPLIFTGNATTEAANANLGGWFIGHFIQENSPLRHTSAIEVKWGVHKKEDQKAVYSFNVEATTMTILISGKFDLHFPDLDTSRTLEQLGDYVIFAPRVTHGWKAIEDSVVLTIRWPSISNDQKVAI